MLQKGGDPSRLGAHVGGPARPAAPPAPGCGTPGRPLTGPPPWSPVCPRPGAGPHACRPGCCQPGASPASGPPGSGLGAGARPQEPRWLLGEGAVSAELWATSYAGFPRGPAWWFQRCSLMGTGSAWSSPLGGRCNPGGRGPGMQLGSSNDPRRGPGRGRGCCQQEAGCARGSRPHLRTQPGPCPHETSRPIGADTSRAPDRPLPEGPPGSEPLPSPALFVVVSCRR